MGIGIMDVVDFERTYPELTELLNYITQCGEAEGIARYRQRRPSHGETLAAEMRTVEALDPLPTRPMQQISCTWLADEAIARRWFQELRQRLQDAA